jgi:hypothetical protein
VPELVELEKEEDIRLLKMLIARYHKKGCPRGGVAARQHRYFALVERGFWVAGAWLHDSTSFRYLAELYRIGHENSYFIRRISNFAPCEWLDTLLKLLAEKLRAEGKECIWTLGLDEYTDMLFKRAGFTEVGKTPRTGHPVLVLRLR